MYRAMAMLHTARLGLLVVSLFGAVHAAWVGAAPGVSAGESYIPLSKHGADTCLKCHDQDYRYPVVAIFHTKHARRDDPRTPFAKLECETCHGPGGRHTQKVMPGKERPPMIAFGSAAATPVAQQNGMCLQCHAGAARIAWKGSTHQIRGLACADCHRIHAPKDPLLSRKSQPQVCFRCHQTQRADIYKASVHPVRFGEVACSDCHAVHGGPAPKLLKKPTVNETCYTCHADKRGPFLWEHPPAAENCTYCHYPHGSNHPALLKKPPPWLCQQCHSQLGHPSIVYDGSGLPGASANPALLAKSCLNCHPQVHGSNHPSGVKRQR